MQLRAHQRAPRSAHAISGRLEAVNNILQKESSAIIWCDTGIMVVFVPPPAKAKVGSGHSAHASNYHVS